MSTPQPVPVADLADDLTAGMTYPARDPFARADHASTVRLFVARRDYWLAAASSYADLAEAAHRNGDPNGAQEAMFDARRCLDNADYYTPDQPATRTA